MASALAAAEAATDQNPTDGRIAAGNYRKGKLRIHGLVVSIENPRGSIRSGKDGSWKVRMRNAYGYILKTEAADGDHVDAFIGPHLKSPHAFVVDQNDHRTGAYDEAKVMLGFGSMGQAKNAYIAAFSDGKGRKRIGHIEHMTIDGLKNWLRNGDTKRSIKRASGGGVDSPYTGSNLGPLQRETDGPPPFEQTSEVPPFDQTAPVTPDAGKMDAAWRGARAGATFNFGDELAGFHAAGPDMGPITRTAAGALRTGYGYLTGNDQITGEYEKGRDEARAADKAAEENHPYINAGAELAGAIPAMAALPAVAAPKGLASAASGIARFGKRAWDAAAMAGQYGGLSGAGEGEGAADRAVKAATGLVSGIVAGPVAQGAGEAVGAGLRKVAGPVVQTVRGWINKEGEAARRVATALRLDNEMIVAGKAQGMTPQQWVAARQNGEPVTLADLGSAHTQSLLRSAANTSPEARAMLEQVIESRFLGQNERVAETVRRAIPGSSGNARKTADQLVAEYDAGRVPAYRTAYQQGDKPIMSPAMERLMGSDTFVGAMKRAISSGKDRDVAEGLGGFNPMVNVTPDGRIVFNKGAQGVPTYPNLQYWDQVKRELDDVATSAYKSGEKGRGDVAKRMAQLLRGELDAQVPTYKNARGIAEQFFGESNALEAGRKLAGKKVDPEEVKAIMRKMKPDERALFQEGYASDLAERVIGNMKDTVNITKGQGMFQSPNERKLAAAIFGPGGMAMLQARMHLERIMDGARQAMGNSTTARQLIEAGLAGGAGGMLGGVSSGWDPAATAGWAGAVAGARLGSAKFVPEQIKVGAKHLIGKVDAKTAAKVAELLTSDDPRRLRQGYQMAAKNEAIMTGLRNIANRLALAGQTGARGPVTEGVRALQGPVGVRADEQQQRPEREWNQ